MTNAEVFKSILTTAILTDISEALHVPYEDVELDFKIFVRTVDALIAEGMDEDEAIERVITGWQASYLQ